MKNGLGSFGEENRRGMPIGEYGGLNGIMIPVSGRAVWYLESGDFPYIQVDITDIEYGVPSPY